jgi:hypothetical protein
MLLRVKRSWLVAVATAVLSALALAPSADAAGSAAASKAAWDHVSASAFRAPAPARPLVTPDRYAAFTLDQDALADVLKAAPAPRRGGVAPRAGAGLAISVPTPDGGFERFTVVDSPVLAPALAAEHPDIKTYSGRGVDDPTATIRLDLTPIGFHASVRGDDSAYYVDPRYRDRSEYVAYPRDAISDDPASAFAATGDDAIGRAPAARPDAAARVNGALVTLRTYRLALVSDPTYATAVGGAGNVTAAKAVLINRVDQIYEQDLAVHLDLIAGNDALNLDTDAEATGTGGPCGAGACFTSGLLASCQTATLTRNALVASKVVGAGSFDLAHLVLGTDGGGVALLGVVGGRGKGGGCTGIPNPTGDAFAVDYVAHEMGHQFGGDHTFNGNASSSGVESNCAPPNRSGTQAVRVEPGSGSSIMAYAGICGQDNLQPHSDPYFSQASITQIDAYTSPPETTINAVQMAALSTTPTSFTLTYDGQQSTTISSFSSTAIRNAIQAIPGWPAGATVSVSASPGTPAGFTVTFNGGAVANTAVGALGFGSLAGATGFIADYAVGGPTRHGGTAQVTGNHAPDVSTDPAFTIPTRTPFLLQAAGSDADSDPLTYLWEENDPGGTTGIPLVSNAKTNGPLFRVFGTAARYSETAAHQSPSPGENVATAQSWRSFPDPLQVAADNTDALTGSCPAAPASGTVPVATVDCYSEYLPTSAWVGVNHDRTLHFRVTARDDDPTAGGIGTADTALTVAPSAGPFRVTSQASASSATTGDPLAVTWDVAGTGAGSAVNAADVAILLSTDGGATFPYTLTSGTPNDGSATVTLPHVTTTKGRIKVAAVGNVFYDMSKANLTITTTDAVLLQAPASVDLGNAGLGGAGADTVVTFTNAGTGAATLAALAFGGPDASAVVAQPGSDSCSGATLAAGASCSVTLRLHPTHAGAHSATVSLSTGDGTSTATVTLTGNGQTAPSLAGPSTANLGGAAVGGQGPDTVVTFTNTGSGSATVGGAQLSGSDAAAVVKAADTCSSRPLAVGASCAITLRLAPIHVGAQAATLTLPSDDPAGPRTVALTGSASDAVIAAPPGDAPVSRTPAPVAPTPAPPAATPPAIAPLPTSAQRASALAAALLDVSDPYKLGSAGRLTLFAATKSTKLGKPRATKLIAAATCTGGSCRGTATAKLVLTPKAKGKRKTTKTITLAKALKLSDGQAAKLTLKLPAKDRKAIKAARKATVTLTVTNGTRKISRTYTLTVG